MGPPAELLQGRAGAESWHQAAQATARAAQALRQRCRREAVQQWRPPGQPPETPHERRARLQGWRFQVDVTAAGETLEKPPEGPGVTLWRSKLKPPPWRSRLPLPSFRDACAGQSNGLAARHAAAVRLVVSRMRQALAQLHEQAKRLGRAHSRLAAALATVRSGLLTNRHCALVRQHRPPAERVPDQPDALLRWERQELQRLKEELEGDLAMSEAHLKALDKCQHTLELLCQERGRALELLGQPLHMVLLEAERDSWLSLSRPSTPFVVRNPTPEPSPFGPYTPECAAAIEEARRLTLRSEEVLARLRAATAQATDLRQGAQVAVGGSLQRKMDETLRLKERLYMTLGGLRSTLNRCLRFHEELDVTQGMTMGPESSKYLEAREKLTRPMVRVYQRHVGTQLPEAQILTQGSELLERSMQKTAANMRQLQATQRHLCTALRDKQMGYEVDGNVQRLRRRRMDPRSSLGEAQQLVCS
ncbi:tektin-like protein 1 [Carettochelys insculpta]|uniref:tektin-like protein 1 n=1 Tax=Carettochelys insculpta TaxID=44489 RepID=UPI003EBCB085